MYITLRASRLRIILYSIFMEAIPTVSSPSSSLLQLSRVILPIASQAFVQPLISPNQAKLGPHHTSFVYELDSLATTKT